MIQTIVLCLLAIGIPQTNRSVDATNETRELARKIVSGSSGGNGHSLPIELKTVIVNGGSQPGDSLFVDFIITNPGPQPLALPTSLRADDFEPKEESSASTFEHLSLFITAGDPKHPLMLKGGADLYGAPRLRGSLRTLNPSESLVVHTKFRLAFSNGTLSGTQSFTAHLSLLDETLKPKGPDLESDSQELGFAAASPFSWTIAAAK